MSTFDPEADLEIFENGGVGSHPLMTTLSSYNVCYWRTSGPK